MGSFNEDLKSRTIQSDVKSNKFTAFMLRTEFYFFLFFFSYSFISWLGPVIYLKKLATPLAIWGLAIFLARFIEGGRQFILKNKLKFIFCLSYLVTIILTLKYGSTVGKIKSLVWFVLIAFLLETVGNDRKVRGRYIRGLVYLYPVISFISSLISLFSYYQNWVPWLPLPDGSYALVGVINRRLFGIYVDPNYGAVLAILSMFFTYYYFSFCKRNRTFSVFSVLNIVVQTLYIALSKSRTGYIVLVLFFIGYLIFLFLDNKERNSKKIIVNAVIALVIVTLVKFPFWTKDALNPVLKACGLPTISARFDVPGAEGEAGLMAKIQENVNKEKQASKKKSAQKKPAVKKDKVERQDTGSSNQERIDLVKQSFELFKHSPLFGVSDRSITTAAEIELPDSLLADGRVPHNGYVFLFLSAGLVGGCVLMLYFFQSIINIIKRLKHGVKNGDENVKEILYAVIPIVACSISAMILQDIFLIMSPTAFLFWFFLGYCQCEDQKLLI